MRLSPAVVADIEWAVLAVTGLIALISLLGALYSIPWTFRARQQATTRAFNYLWITRALLQVIAACYALSLDLRLQVLWSAKSVVIPGGYHVDAMCRLYIGLSFGLLEPSFLLLVLFACSHSVSKHSDPGDNPNLFITALTLGLTLPMCAVQVFAALFSRIMTQLRYNEELMYKFFAASASAQDTMCPGEPDNPNCAVCLFPAFSTIISAAFALMYLLVLWAVLGRVAGAAINRMLARRIRLLQVCITLFFCASITLRGVTAVNIDPFSLDFVALWFANVLACCALIGLVSVILVWVPVYDGRAAGATLGAALMAPSLLNAPTELLPLVGYGVGGGYSAGKGSYYSHDPPSSEYDPDDDYSDGGAGAQDEQQQQQQQQQQQYQGEAGLSLRNHSSSLQQGPSLLGSSSSSSLQQQQQQQVGSSILVHQQQPPLLQKQQPLPPQPGSSNSSSSALAAGAAAGVVRSSSVTPSIAAAVQQRRRGGSQRPPPDGDAGGGGGIES